MMSVVESARIRSIVIPLILIATSLALASCSSSPSPLSSGDSNSTFQAQIPIALPVPQSTGPHAITFANIVSHVSELPQVAWGKVQAVIAANKPVRIPSSVYVGPNTTLDVEGGLSRIQQVLSKDERLWSGFQQTAFYAMYFYNTTDVAVTSKQFAQDFNAKGYDSARDENLAGPLRALAGNCQQNAAPGQFQEPLSKCTGSDSGSYFNSNDSYLQVGQTGDSRDFFITDGGNIGQEYIHAEQQAQWIDDPLCGNPNGGGKLCSRDGMSNVGFSPCWLFQGQSKSIGAMVSSRKLADYVKYRNTHLPYGQGPTNVTDYSQQSIQDYLFNQSHTTCYQNGELFKLGNTVGALAAEALVAIAGPQATMAVFSLGAEGQDFPTAFKNVYGMSWSDASTILSKVVAAEYATFGPPPR